MKKIALLFLPLLLAIAALALGVSAADSTKTGYDRSKVEVSTGTAVIDTTAATWTSYVPLITIAPQSDHALLEAKVWIDLDKATTGFADASGWDTETITFAVQRKVDGTNWSTAKNTETTAISADNSDGYSQELNLGMVSPGESVRVVAKVSAQVGNADVQLPYVVIYRAGARATITAAAAD